MEAVLQRPRVSARGSIFDRAKNFFTNIFNRRKTKSRVAVDSKVVENTNARIISVEDTMSLLSSIYPLESLVEIYEQRVANTNQRIEELKTNFINNPENQEAIQNEYYELVKNLKVDSYILETKKKELEKMQAEAQKQAEKSEAATKEEAATTEKENSLEYTELYNRIKYLFEEKIRLSNARINRINNINSLIESIDPNANDFQGKLMYLMRLNDAFNTNAKEETMIDNQLNAFIKEIYALNPNFNFNEEFGDLTRQIASPRDEFIRTNVTTILEKQYLLEQEMSNAQPATQEVLKGILKELDTTLSNLNYNLSNPEILANIINEVNEQIAAKYSNSKEETKNEVEEPDAVNNESYNDLLSRIEKAIEKKIKLANERIDTFNNLNGYIGSTESNIDEFKAKLINVTLFNEALNKNANDETIINDELNSLIASAKQLNSDFNLNQEFGNLFGKIPVPSEDIIRANVTTIIEKQYLLEQQMSHFNEPTQEVMKGILRQLDTVLSNLSYKLPNPEMLSSIIAEINEQVSAKYANSQAKTESSVEGLDESNLEVYKEQLSRIENTIEEKAKLSSARIKLFDDLNNYLASIDSNTDDFQGKLIHIGQINEELKANADEQTKADGLLDGLRVNARLINSNFDFNQQFGSLFEKIPAPTEDFIRTIVTTIIEKQYILDQEMSRVKQPTQEVLKDIIKELDTVLSNLSYKLPDSEKLSSIITEVNEQITAKYSNNNEMAQSNAEVEEKKEASIKDEIKPVIDPNEGIKKEKERKNRYLEELRKQYNKINSINDIVSNPLNMTYDASIYFEQIAAKTYKKINQIKANLRAMTYVSPDEIKDLEVFPGALEDFISLHKEKILRASDELVSLKSLAAEDEKTLKRIITLQKYLESERELVERRLVFEKRRDNTINILGYLSQINEGATLPKDEPVEEEPTIAQLTQARIERTKIFVTKPQRITRIKSLIETYPLYKVEQCKKSIKIKINKHARRELKKLLGEIKIIINNNNGLKGVKVTTTENKKGYEVQEISNLAGLDNLKVVVSTGSQEVESEEVVSNGRSL